MTQAQLDREVARATVESIPTIRNLGFDLVEPPELKPQKLIGRPSRRTASGWLRLARGG
jgi:hypothetical protein